MRLSAVISGTGARGALGDDPEVSVVTGDSRQVVPGGNTYCSAVCCTYTQKQVILSKDHDADLEATVFHNDIRSYGKDFERFYQRAEGLPLKTPDVSCAAPAARSSPHIPPVSKAIRSAPSPRSCWIMTATH